METWLELNSGQQFGIRLASELNGNEARPPAGLLVKMEVELPRRALT